jgi:type II secretory pathway component PulF
VAPRQGGWVTIRAVTASIWFYLFPLYILGGLLLVLGTFALLGRIQGGRYLKPIINFMMKLPLVGRLMKKASQAALERQNPELASAVKKLERSGVARDPMRAQQALSRLSASERQAYLDATADQTENIAQNRQMRRQLERTRKGKRR